MRKIMVKILGIAVLLITLFLPNTCAFANEEKTNWKILPSVPTSVFMRPTEVVDGKIYAIGEGYGNYPTIISPIEVYDSSTNKWSTKACMPIALPDYLQTEVIDGKIYAIGGWGTNYDISTEVYDHSTDAWTVLAPMTIAQDFDFQTEVIDGKIYTIGHIDDYTRAPSTEVYDPFTDTWTILAAMPTARDDFQTEVVDGKIYAIGGFSGSLLIGGVSNANSLSTTEVYDPSTDTWTTLAPMSTPRYEFQTEVINGKIYAIGGLNVSAGESIGEALSSIEVYDASTNTWTTLTSAPTTMFQTEVIDDKIYAIGGNAFNDLVSIEVYDTSSDTWTSLDSMSKSKYFYHSEVIDNVIYAFFDAAYSFESYTLDTNASK